MVVPLPRSTRSDDLVAWYEAAIRQALHNHPAALMNLTTADVVGRFPPPDAHNTGRKQRLAAAQALERLACSGLLYRHAATGEMHYLND